MDSQWYYSHDGITHGPFSGQQLKEQAARRLLLENDLLWQGGREARDPLPAQAALDFSNLSPVVALIPEWLEDMGADEGQAAVPAPVASNEAPAWLEDLRLWLALDGPRADEAAPGPSVIKTGVPDWLSGFALEPATPAPPSKAPAILPSVPELSPPQAVTAVLPAKTTPVEDVARPSTQETGFDASTGRIIDQDIFRKWQKTARAGEPGVTNESLFEVFRRARIAIENWVDEDSNRGLVLAGDIPTMKKDSRLAAVFHASRGFGPAMEEKLLRHLKFIVGNRSKYYRASRRS